MDNQDFNRIYDEHYRLVMATAKNIIDDDRLCEDVCQEVFIKFLRSGQGIDPQEIRFWLLRVTRNAALDYRRKLKLDVIKTQPIGEEERGADMDKDPLRQILRREHGRKVLDALREHDPRGMEILIGIEIEGRTTEELAAQYDITPNNVRNRLYRARKWLKERFPREEGYF